MNRPLLLTVLQERPDDCPRLCLHVCTSYLGKGSFAQSLHVPNECGYNRRKRNSVGMDGRQAIVGPDVARSPLIAANGHGGSM
jgi:hypothetical protein